MPLRSYSISLVCGVLLAIATLGLSSCGTRYYPLPANNFGGRPTPPSLLQQRVLVGLTTTGTQGELEILDGLRNLRNNIQDTKPTFSISGYSGVPVQIMNFPEQSVGYAYSSTGGSLTQINDGTEAAGSSAGTFPNAAGIAVPPTRARIYVAEEAAGQLFVVDNVAGASYALNLPNVFQVIDNVGDTVTLAMTRNSNTLYRIFKLNVNQYPTAQAAVTATGSIDCEPFNVPIYCVVPVPGNFDRPSNAYFSVDGTQVYVLNSGPELGGTTASVSFIPQSALVNTIIPTAPPTVSPVTATLPIPGGVTDAISDGFTLYLAGQSTNTIASNGTTVTGPNPGGLFAGYLTTVNVASQQIANAYSISDGSHSQMLFADNDTLWIGSQNCSTGVRQYLFSQGNTTQAANYNCLTMFNVGNATPQIVPAVNKGASVGVPYPNTYETDPYYYGSLTGICWVQNYGKVYTAYGGQVHAFNTADGSEINNFLFTVQGTALTVVYMDSLTNEAN